MYIVECEINGGPIDNVYRKLCRSTGISKAVDQLVYRKSYKVKGFITFGMCSSWFWLLNNRKTANPSDNLGSASIYDVESVISLKTI